MIPFMAGIGMSIWIITMRKIQYCNWLRIPLIFWNRNQNRTHWFQNSATWWKSYSTINNISISYHHPPQLTKLYKAENMSQLPPPPLIVLLLTHWPAWLLLLASNLYLRSCFWMCHCLLQTAMAHRPSSEVKWGYPPTSPVSISKVWVQIQ